MKPENPMLEANTKALASRFPFVLERILRTKTTPSENFFYRKEEDKKAHTLLLQRGEHVFPVYGKYRKENLIKRWIKTISLEKESLYGITGFGDGSHVKAILENSSSGTFLLIAEKDPALLRDTFSLIDCSDILLHERILLGVGDLDDDFFRDIQSASLTSISEVNSIIFSPLHNVDEGYYDRMRNELLRQYLVVRPLMEVNIRTATNIQENTFKNLPHLAHAPDVGELKDNFKDIPFILIGAGPSLDESINFLKSVQDKAIIVASNSPYRKLINNGIRPHLVVTADPMEPTMTGFQNVKTDHVPLACPFSAYPEIVQKFSGRILTWSTFNPISDYIKNAYNYPPATKILEQGTVSGCVLDLSKLFGCEKVIFIGQDMSVQDDGKYYTDDSFYADSGDHYISTDKGHKLPGNTNDTVLVENRLFVYLKTFEQFISQNPNIQYRNLARTGVKIKGVPYMDYNEALDWIGESSSASFDSRVKSLLSEQKSSQDLQNIFQPLINYTERIFSKSLSAALETEMLPEKFSGINYSSNKKLKDLFKAGSEVNNLVDSNNQYWQVLFDGKTKSQLVVYKRLVRDIDFPNKTWSSVQRNKEYFWALSEGCNWLLTELSKFTDCQN